MGLFFLFTRSAILASQAYMNFMNPRPFQTVFEELQEFLKTAEKPLIVIAGPTASGKTKLAVKIAHAVGGEVINADSRQVYMEMIIGNELTKPEEMEGIPHHLLSFVPLERNYTVADFKRDAEDQIDEIRGRGSVPIICGGTMLWTDAVVDNFSLPEGEPDWEFRDQLLKLSAEELLEKLEAVDPESAEQLKSDMNPRYLTRALEIFEMTGKKKSEISEKGERQYEVFKMAPYWDREVLYERINARTQVQFENGMVEEQDLVDKYAEGTPEKLLELRWPGLTSIGCKEVIPFLKGDATAEETVELLRRNNRRYAKRQISWLKKDEEIRWISE